MTRWAARSIEAKSKFWKKKKGNLKGAYIDKWYQILEPFLEPWPDAIVNKTVESIQDLELKDLRAKKQRIKALLAEDGKEVSSDEEVEPPPQPKKETLFENRRKDAEMTEAEKKVAREEERIRKGPRKGKFLGPNFGHAVW